MTCQIRSIVTVYGKKNCGDNSSVCLQGVLSVLSSEIDEKLIELVRKCEEL
jgi:hypothetical protein